MLGACPASTHIAAPSERIDDADVLLAQVAARAARIQDLSAEARVSYYGEEGARKAKAVILAKRPAALHFSVYSPTDDMLAVLASNGERFTYFERGQPTCYGGRSCAENVGRFSVFPLEGAQLVDALSGGVPLVPSTKTRLFWDRRSGSYQLERLGEEGVVQRIWVAHGSWRILRMEVHRGEALELSLAFSDIKRVADVELAHRIDMRMPAKSIDLRVSFREVELNTDLGSTPFEIPCPEGTRQERLLCYDEEPNGQSKPSSTEGAPRLEEEKDGS